MFSIYSETIYKLSATHHEPNRAEADSFVHEALFGFIKLLRGRLSTYRHVGSHVDLYSDFGCNGDKYRKRMFCTGLIS